MSSSQILFSSMTIDAFASSPCDTKARFLTVAKPEAAQDVRHEIHGACKLVGSNCSISSQAILMEQKDGSWLPSTILTATMKRAEAKNESPTYVLDDYDCAVTLRDTEILVAKKNQAGVIDMKNFLPLSEAPSEDFLIDVNALFGTNYNVEDFE